MFANFARQMHKSFLNQNFLMSTSSGSASVIF